VVTMHTDEPLAVAVVEASHMGDVRTLERLLAENPCLGAVRLGDADQKGTPAPTWKQTGR
jgi:hypothetical protein